MPEGPEVKRFGKDLAAAVSGRVLLSVEIMSGRYIKKDLPDGFLSHRKYAPHPSDGLSWGRRVSPAAVAPRANVRRGTATTSVLFPVMFVLGCMYSSSETFFPQKN